MTTLRKDLEWFADFRGTPEPKGGGPIFLVIIGIAVLILFYGCH